ncbi:sugar ABC transporter substrate-binding protein [Herbivorax sp. ANBcel31]|uniref:sugar ABC transporter substrate-binding protein n=1 Tax=Herbivorax sp. ANBcel31 TaxID=3069754 RepID=UPI0027AF3BE6|nr:sugar ABC transporter substrate-binding protein [Herbivorax sp. ANBcel31]MDQ2085071.1 sugar ABC transporter substrate-binding protein [Herbivorax sp. ANBcel31]
MKYSVKIATLFLVIIVSLNIFLTSCDNGNDEIKSDEFKHGQTVCLLMPYTGEYWWNTIAKYFELAVTNDGWNFKLDTADGSEETQAEQILNYAQQSDILFVFPTSSTAINDAIKTAEQEYNCPVVSFKGFVTEESRFSVIFDDYNAAKSMAKEAVEWIKEKHGTTEGKTIVSINGDLRQSGWGLRQEGFDWIKENHPEINYISLIGGLAPNGWAEAIDEYFAGTNEAPDAIISGSDGSYLVGTLSALEKYDKLYYAGDPNHIFIASIDGKPSTLTWLRKGLIDSVYAQVPNAISNSAWEIAKEYILKDASYQYEPYEMPEIPLPLVAKQPEGTYWGNDDMTVNTYEYSKTPIGQTPFPIVNKDNVNNWDLYGNSIVKILGEDIHPLPKFKPKGEVPTWSQNLLDEYNNWITSE